MPQKDSHNHIMLSLEKYMSTIQIHKEQEPGHLVQNNPTKKIEREIKQNPYLKWEDLAGLSWILLDEVDG